MGFFIGETIPDAMYVYHDIQIVEYYYAAQLYLTDNDVLFLHVLQMLF